MGKNVTFALILAAGAAPAFAAWSPPETLSPPGGEWSTCYNFATALVADGEDNLHAVFFQLGGGAYYRRYDRAAERWEPRLRLDEYGGRDAALLGGTEGRLHAFFKSGDELCHRLGDASGNWGPHEYLAVAGYPLGFPSPLQLPSGDVALAMVGESIAERRAYIWFTIWRAASGEFDAPERLSETTGRLGSWMPTLAYFRGRLRLVWRDDSTGDFELYERERGTSGWTPRRRLTFDPASTYHPRLTVDDEGALRLFFMDNRRGRAALWEMVDRGGGWGPARVLYDGGGESYHPNVASSPPGARLLFWEDTRGGRRKEIYWGALRGGVWSAGARITHTPEVDSGCPSAAVTRGGEAAVIYNEGGTSIRVQTHSPATGRWAGVTFEARARPPAVSLRWRCWPADRYRSYNLYRRAGEEGAWHRLNASPVTGRPPFIFRDEPAAPGRYTYKLEGVKDGGGRATLATEEVTLGEGKPFAARLSVSPNPCRASCRLRWPQESEGEAHVEIYDLAGRRLVSARTAGVAGANDFRVATEGLAPGLYVAAVTAEGRRLYGRFVVAR